VKKGVVGDECGKSTEKDKVAGVEGREAEIKTRMRL